MGLSPRAEHRILNWIHVIEFVLIHAALGISAYRILSKKVKTTRNDTWILGVAAKSLVIMAYVVLTEHCRPLWKRASVKANFVLAVLETVFWFAAPIMIAMRIGSCSAGLGCTLSWTNMVLGFTIAALTIPVLLISFKQWRVYKQTGIVPGSKRFAAQEKELSNVSSPARSVNVHMAHKEMEPPKAHHHHHHQHQHQHREHREHRQHRDHRGRY